MKTTLALLAISILLTSCTQHDESKLTVLNNAMAKDRFTLVKSGEIEIPLDSTSFNFSHYPVYYTNDSVAYYVSGNEIINSIDFYDLKTRKLVRRNMYPTEGPDGLINTLKLFVKSLDSIYVYPTHPDLLKKDHAIVLTNFSGEILHRYPMPWLDRESWMTHLAAPLTIIGDNAYFSFMKYGDNRAQIQQRALVEWNMKTGSYVAFGPQYPDAFKQYYYDDFTPIFALGYHNTFVVSFQSLPFVHGFNINRKDSIVDVPMRSQFQQKEIVPNKTITDAHDRDRDFEELGQGQYTQIQYDPFQLVYYYTYQDGIAIYNADGEKNSWDDKPISIIIFNTAFEYCGEFQLPANTYMPNNFIPSKEGLLIPTSHPKNANNNEDILHFDVFKLARL
ncbi:DUF4221 family protein [Pseudochryseolinea flava]|uniref:DUF4221 domain-containing protein n=1 Tax=Pseudochryseolinea flava TaxID=2059302 RepID=A0A364Y0Q6_9BACT|nr:DUF4221 family protein [Pseudochryseolinea flava]RAV99507.1 hypothetical protein DQQ10_18045 [Pseudochryseolinea flava]